MYTCTHTKTLDLHSNRWKYKSFRNKGHVIYRRKMMRTTEYCQKPHNTVLKWYLKNVELKKKNSTQVPYLVKTHFKNEEEIISLKTEEWMYSYIPTLQEMLKDIL